MSAMPGPDGEFDKVLVVDFGAQYAQLIARRVREANVYSEIISPRSTAAEIAAKAPTGIIFSGGPDSVHADGAIAIDPAVYDLDIPILGICYGAQLIAQQNGGTVGRTDRGEYGRTVLTVEGDGGRIPATIATPLSVVLTELLQNAVEHAFGEGSGGGSVVVGLAHDDDHLTITVVDDGRGVARGFDLEQATGLGLSIVRTLVTTELAGTIEMMPASVDDLASAGLDTGGTAHGTVVRLRVPTSEE